MKNILATTNRKLTLFGVVIVLYLLTCAFANAGIYYVDYQSGRDTNNGLSTSTPWKHSPGDASCSGTCASTTLKAGDTVIFKGGVTYTGTGGGALITINQSGVSGNYITYDGNSAGTWGTGQAIIDLNHTYFYGFYASSKNYIKILNFDIKKAKNHFSSASLTAGSCPAGQAKVYRNGSDQCVTYSGGVSYMGYIFLMGSSNWLIKDCKIHETENYTDLCVYAPETDGDVSTISSVPADQIGINIYSGNSNIEVDSCEIYAIGRDAMRIISSSNINVHDCDFGGISAGSATGYFSVGARIAGSSNAVTFANNRIHDGYQYAGTDTKIRCHANDWFHMYGNNNGLLEAGSDPHNIVIERNFLYNNVAFTKTNGTAFIFLEDDVYDVRISNNVFVNPFAFMVELEVVDRIGIYNNTFVNWPMTGGISPIWLIANTISNPEVRIKNNIFYNTSTNTYVTPIYMSAGAKNPTESDYNIFYNTGHTIAVRKGTTGWTLSQWQAQTCGTGRCDAHSHASDPLLHSIPLTGAKAGDGKYMLTPASIDALDKGTILTEFSNDKRGVVRTGIWDIGAYEGTSLLSPPPNFGIQQ